MKKTSKRVHPMRPLKAPNPARSPRQEAPDFLIRLTGKARANSLAKDVWLRHRHD
jgi:hypothetical protein